MWVFIPKIVFSQLQMQNVFVSKAFYNNKQTKTKSIHLGAGDRKKHEDAPVEQTKWQPS